MNIYIDIGNTKIKYITSKNPDKFHDYLYDLNNIDQIVDQIKEYNTTDIYISSVVSWVSDIFKEQLNNTHEIKITNLLNYISVDLKESDPIENSFDLGIDILLGCYALIERKNYIIVDMGSATTVSSVIDGSLRNILIYPGSKWMEKKIMTDINAIHQNNISNNTYISIHNGLSIGNQGSIISLIEHAKSLFTKNTPEVYISGGDRFLIEFEGAKYFEDIVLNGLIKYVECSKHEK